MAKAVLHPYPLIHLFSSCLRLSSGSDLLIDNSSLDGFHLSLLKAFFTTEVTEALRCTEKTLKSRNLERQQSLGFNLLNPSSVPSVTSVVNQSFNVF